MERIKCVVRYDGTNFLGFQIQKTGRTVQDELQKALSTINKKEMIIVGAGRTDARVHANGQVFHFDTDLKLSIVQWKLAINSLLPGDIHVTSVEKVDNDFHARYSAISKEYIYIINIDEYNPLEANYVYQFCHFMDVEKITRAAKLFEGKHDFRNFCANDEEETKNYIRTISSIELYTKDKKLHIIFNGDGFLRYMVRTIVGTLIEVGMGRQDEKYIINKLKAEEHELVPYRAPGQGLYLEEVEYPTVLGHDLANYHTHTYRCMHANGSDEEYVQSALKKGYKVIGFSDHMMVPGVDNDVWTRGKWSDFPGYVESINRLKEKYKDKIKVYVGMECEYFPELHDWLKGLLTSGQLEYLIYGNHYRHFDGKSITGYFGYCTTDDDVIEYTTMAIQALKTGLFSCFAHPDLFMTKMESWTPVCEDCAIQLCTTAKEMDVPLEINQGGIRYSIEDGYDIEKRYKYPYFRFWEIAKKVGNKVVIGIDAHNPKDFNNVAVKLSYDFARKLGLKIEPGFEFKKVK